MPELPEVETTRRGIEPHLLDHRVTKVIIRKRQLRWPVPRGLANKLVEHTIEQVGRRAKYLLLKFDHGTLIMHLGMSGHLRIVPADTPAQKHDHLDLILDDGHCLRFNDARRFGSVHWTCDDPQQHKLLRDLGPEPLDKHLGKHLYQQSRGRKTAIKHFLMNSHVVVGIGNIYASEALFRAGIHPARAAGRISLGRYEQLAKSIANVIRAAIRAGGTTLRDFTGGDGRPGYFRQSLKVYGREGGPCVQCGRPVCKIVQGQRSTWYCKHCQT
jgi:formamidopyrimidine-DNA glycosylase